MKTVWQLKVKTSEESGDAYNMASVYHKRLYSSLKKARRDAEMIIKRDGVDPSTVSQNNLKVTKYYDVCFHPDSSFYQIHIERLQLW